jgi:hypothetical protein
VQLPFLKPQSYGFIYAFRQKSNETRIAGRQPVLENRWFYSTLPCPLRGARSQWIDGLLVNLMEALGIECQVGHSSRMAEEFCPMLEFLEQPQC